MSKILRKTNKKRLLVLACCKAKLYKNEKCKCKYIKIIKKIFKLWKIKVNNLPKVEYNKCEINFKDINLFIDSIKKDNYKRSENDKNNKKRENIIASIINSKLPIIYFKYSLRWNRLKQLIINFIKKLCKMKDIKKYENIICIHKAGRNNYFDFKIIVNEIEFNIEFKFNACSINDTPQFISPMKPSQYLESSYEEYFYNNYLIKIIKNKEYNLNLPDIKEYLKQIHSSNPKCMKNFQEKYYKGCKQSSKYSGNENDIKFYEKMKKISKESIYNFICLYDLKYDKLSNYLLNTQKNKYYMLYKNNNIYLQTIDQDNYKIKEVVKEPKHSRYIASTKSGKKLYILLRWKNGNGIAYPSFQIS